MKKMLTYKGAVMTWECDSNRHMNVMYYINKFEHAGRNTNIYLDIDNVEGVDNLGIVVLEQQIKYLREVFEDDLIYVESTLLGIGNKAFTMLHEMYNTKTKVLVSTMKATLVYFDKDKRKAVPFPKNRKAILLKAIEN